MGKTIFHINYCFVVFTLKGSTKRTKRVVENICVLCSELVEYGM